MKTEEKLNLTMLCDFYELTMGNGYFRAGLQDRITYFDVFFRNVPDNGGFAVCAGLEQLAAMDDPIGQEQLRTELADGTSTCSPRIS